MAKRKPAVTADRARPVQPITAREAGQRGGIARAASLSARRRREIAKAAGIASGKARQKK